MTTGSERARPVAGPERRPAPRPVAGRRAAPTSRGAHASGRGLVAALTLGLLLACALVTALASGLAYNFFFIEPRFTLHISARQGVVTVCLFLIAALVAGRLRGWGIETHTGIGRTGVVGVIRGRAHGSNRAIGLRADMDALPMEERTNLPYSSKIANRFHG